MKKDNKKNLVNFPNFSHCRLLPYINDCNCIDSILEKKVYTISVQYM